MSRPLPNKTEVNALREKSLEHASLVSARFGLVAVRHGETTWNLENRIQGHKDSPLTPTGRMQAQAMARRLSTMGLQALYSSDLGRARETAEIIGPACGLSPKTDPRFRERNLGIFEALTYAETQKRFPEEFARFKTWDATYQVPEGESSLQFKERIANGLDDLHQRHPGERIGLVTHGGVLDLMMRLAIGLPLNIPRAYSLFNASLNRFSRDNGRWVLDTWGDTSHLDGVTKDDASIPANSL